MANANVVTWAGRSIFNNRLIGNGTQPTFVGWGLSTDTGSAFSDVNLFLASDARVSGTGNLLSANQLADTYQVVATITAPAVRAVTEVALFDSTSSSPNTTISATVNATTTSFGLIGAGAAGMPTAGVYYAQLDNEVVAVTAGQNSNTLTVTRGALGSTAAAHNSGNTITAGGDGGAHAANSSIGVATWSPTGANGGSAFCHADFPVINLANQDSIQFTLKIQLQ